LLIPDEYVVAQLLPHVVSDPQFIAHEIRPQQPSSAKHCACTPAQP